MSRGPAGANPRRQPSRTPLRNGNRRACGRLDARGVWIEECRPDAGDRILDDPVMRRAGVAIAGGTRNSGSSFSLVRWSA